MSKNIVKVAITGGACSGKTTLLANSISKFSDLGYKLLTVPETATELKINGITPNSVGLMSFQKLLIEKQLNKEKLYNKAAQLSKEDNIVILFDRGLQDNKAYVSQEEYIQLLRCFNETEVSFRDRYNAVIHLVSAAKGAETFYTLDNNLAREESLDEAKDLDDRTMQAWIGHPHLRIIDNSTDFESKMKRALKEIYHILGKPAPIEIEQKYLIKMPNITTLSLMSNFCPVNILQTYLNQKDFATERRVRQRGADNDFTYFYTEKKKVSSKERVETESIISQSEYLSLLLDSDTKLHQIAKKRYCFVYENQYFELDIYPFCKDKAILEIELSEKNQRITLPPYIQVIDDVTKIQAYKNHALAENQTL